MITYKINESLDSKDVLHLFNEAGIGKPNWTPERLQRSIDASTITITAWDNNILIGYLSAISDLAWVGYISQFAIDPKFQKLGIGKEMIHQAEEKLGDEVTLVLHSSDTATGFYESMGFEAYSNTFRKKRKL